MGEINWRVTHGSSVPGSPNNLAYRSWNGMKDRCLNKKNKNYYRYGGRGIRVCKRWSDSFANFLADMGDRPAGHFLDRINFNGDYGPKNCRWANAKLSSENRSCVMRVTTNGVDRLAVEVAVENGLAQHVFYGRIRLGWNIRDAVTIPKEPRRPKSHSQIR